MQLLSGIGFSHSKNKTFVSTLSTDTILIGDENDIFDAD